MNPRPVARPAPHLVLRALVTAFPRQRAAPIALAGAHPRTRQAITNTRHCAARLGSAPSLTSVVLGASILLMIRIINETHTESGHGAPAELPGGGLDIARMPGHWLLARMGKRVLRPGGLELTRQLLESLAIGPHDHVVELAPGLGTTTRLVLARNPASYVAVERDVAAARATARLLRGSDRCQQGHAADTQLPASSASVVFGEAMLSMQSTSQKEAIVSEAHRVLGRGGAYGIHELALTPDGLGDGEKGAIERALSEAIHVGARPLTVAEWRGALERQGFVVTRAVTAPMHLLEPRRIVADEGWLGALRLASNVARTPAARRRILAMRAVFRRYADNLCAVMMVARKHKET